MGLRLVPKSVTLNGIMALILHYFPEFVSLELSVPITQKWLISHHQIFSREI